MKWTEHDEALARGEAVGYDRGFADATSHYQAAIAELVEALERQKTGWDAALDIDMIPERYRDAALDLVDDAHALIAKHKAVKP